MFEPWQPTGREAVQNLMENEKMLRRLTERVVYARKGGEVVRYHTRRKLLEDTTGHHMFNVAWLVHFASVHLGQVERYTLILAALSHDLPEQDVGDVPAPAKREMGIRETWGAYEYELNADMGFGYVQALSAEGHRILKFCDAIDGALHSAHEKALGNSTMVDCYQNFMNYAQEVHNPDLPHEAALLHIAKEAWNGR